MRFTCFTLLFLWLTPARAEPLEGADQGYTVTITGTYTVDGQRIDLGAFQKNTPKYQNYLEPSPIYLALTNLTPKPLTYAFHTTGPAVDWEFDVGGTIYKCSTQGQGSGVFVSKTLQPRQSGVIVTKLLYHQIPKELKTLILAPQNPISTFIDAKVRVSLRVDTNMLTGKSESLTIKSDWAAFQVGSASRPEDINEPEAPDKSASETKPNAK